MVGEVGRRQLDALMAWVEAMIDTKLDQEQTHISKHRARAIRAELFQSFGIADIDPPIDG